MSKKTNNISNCFFCIFALSNRGVAQLASVLAWGASGRPFESDRSDRQVVSNDNLFLFNLYKTCLQPIFYILKKPINTTLGKVEILKTDSENICAQNANQPALLMIGLVFSKMISQQELKLWQWNEKSKAVV